MQKQIIFARAFERSFCFYFLLLIFVGILFYFLLGIDRELLFSFRNDAKEGKHPTFETVLDHPDIISAGVWEEVPYVDEMESLGLERNAFFLETSGRGQVSLRQLLGVEAAARNLRDLRNLFVYIAVDDERKKLMTPFARTPIMISLEERYPLIHFRLVTFKDFIIGTPLEGWYKSKAFNDSPSKIEHMSDVFRTILLAKFGGIYLDFDVLFKRWWTFPNNSVFWENNNGKTIANCVLAFGKNHSLMSIFPAEFVKNYNPHIYVNNGPGLMKTLYLRCNSTGKCDVQCFPYQMVVPVHFSKLKDLYKEDQKVAQAMLDIIKDNFALHVSNKVTKDEKLLSSSQSAIAIILRLNCPIVWKEITKIGYA